MFNLKNQEKAVDDKLLLYAELDSFDIVKIDIGYQIRLGDETIEVGSLSECKELIQAGIQELKYQLWQEWHELSAISDLVAGNNAGNDGSLANLYFLSNVKKSFLLSKQFSDLKNVTANIYRLFNIDVKESHPNLIREFNRQYLKVKLLHKLIMQEMYRLRLLKIIEKLSHKTANVSGPWANLDLPMKERVWQWDEDEEYFDLREQSRKEQIRYNPEFTKEGFYYVWQDLRRDPYRFEDFKTDSPYKSRHHLMIP